MLGAHPRRARHSEKRNLDLVLALFPRLEERFPQQARTMSGGEQQMLAIGRAMMSAPEILLLDEPSLGLSPMLAHELFQALGRVRETGVGVLLVEQNARQSLAISDRGYLIETGRIVGHGEARDLAADPAVREAYLGAHEVHARALRGRNRDSPNPGRRGGASPARGVRRHVPPPTASTNRRRSSPARPKPEGHPMFHTKLIIADRDLSSGDSRTFDRRDPMTGEVATRAAAASPADAQRAADAAAAAFPEWSAKSPRRAAEAPPQGRRPPRGEDRRLRRGGGQRDRQPGALGAFQCRARRRHDPRSGIDDDADHRRGDPVEPAGLDRLCHAPAGRRDPVDRALERADHPRRPLGGDAARLRQYRRVQGLGELPAHPCADRRGLPRGRPAARRHQPRHQRARGCGEDRRGADLRIPR